MLRLIKTNFCKLGFVSPDILYDSWSPAMTVSSICISILSMLSSSTVKVLFKVSTLASTYWIFSISHVKMGTVLLVSCFLTCCTGFILHSRQMNFLQVILIYHVQFKYSIGLLILVAWTGQTTWWRSLCEEMPKWQISQGNTVVVSWR